MSNTNLPASFVQKKKKILSLLSVPTGEYNDLSPKGSIDVGIRELIDEINSAEGWVTTSSCAGRVSIFAEGIKRESGKDIDQKTTNEVVNRNIADSQDHVDNAQAEDVENSGMRKLAGTGGKGGGGHWLFVSHDPIELEELQKHDGGLIKAVGLKGKGDSNRVLIGTGRRLVHFKFEPMILHVLTASLFHAQSILSAALQAGFRESGALNLLSTTSEAPTPMVGIRSMGLGLESVIGVIDASDEAICTISEDDLRGLLEIANERFVENTARIDRFRKLLKQEEDTGKLKLNPEGVEWEDAEERRQRKRREGLEKAKVIREQRAEQQREASPDIPDVG